MVGRSARVLVADGVGDDFAGELLLAGGVAGSGSGCGLAASTTAGSLATDATWAGGSTGVAAGGVTGVGACSACKVAAIGMGWASELRETA